LDGNEPFSPGGNRQAEPCADEPFIDTVSKAISVGASRRTVLKLMAGGFAAMLGLGMAGCVRTDDHLKPRVVGTTGTGSEVAACPSCGACAQCSYDATTGAGACVPCEESCLTAVVCTAANRDERYRTLADYLVAQGYQARTQPDGAGGAAPAIVHAVDTLVWQIGGDRRPVTRLLYTHGQQSTRTAILYYAQLNLDEAHALVTRFDGDTFTDVVYVDEQGHLVTEQPDPSRTPTLPPLASDAAPGATVTSLVTGMAVSELAIAVPQHPAQAASFLSGMCDLTCEILSNVPKADCILSLGALCAASLELLPFAVVCMLAMTYICQEFSHLAGDPIKQQCENHLCCSPDCDDKCEVCLNGQCVSKCSSGDVCCDGTCEPAPAAQVDRCGGSCLWCSCNGKTYTDTQECQDECRVGTGCFTGICQPAPCPAVA
jgi:hypothetical protein